MFFTKISCINYIFDQTMLSWLTYYGGKMQHTHYQPYEDHNPSYPRRRIVAQLPYPTEHPQYQMHQQIHPPSIPQQPQAKPPINMCRFALKLSLLLATVSAIGAMAYSCFPIL